jgi:hypothetical protein
MLLPLTAAALARWNHCQLCIGIGTLTVIGPPLGTDGTARIQLWNLLSFVVFFEDRWAFFLLIRTTCTAQAAPELSNVLRTSNFKYFLAEGVGFEPTVRLPVRLISSQVPSTTQPPFHSQS